MECPDGRLFCIAGYTGMSDLGDVFVTEGNVRGIWPTKANNHNGVSSYIQGE